MTLEIKPGKYRTREGAIATVSEVNGRIAEGTVGDGPFNAYVWALDDDGANLGLIERIEDEPKAEEQSKITGAVECLVETGKPVRKHITDDAWAATMRSRLGTRHAHMRPAHESANAEIGVVLISVAEHDMLLTAARVVDTANTYAKEACGIVGDAQAALDEATKRIARLEAENESLSRQLRSRELNKEPATGGKVWRWSPLV